MVSAMGITDFAQAAVLEEVAVTARKRAENLQDVPMAVTAFNAEQLREAQVDSILDYGMPWSWEGRLLELRSSPRAPWF